MVVEEGMAVILDTGNRLFSGEVRYHAGWHHLRVTSEVEPLTLKSVDNEPFPAHDLLGDDKSAWSLRNTGRLFMERLSSYGMNQIDHGTSCLFQ
jgi:hypothetical protein